MAEKEGITLNCKNEIILISVFMLHSIILNKTNTGRNIFFDLCFISARSYATDKRLNLFLLLLSVSVSKYNCIQC